MVNLTVDGKNISAPKGTMLLEAIRGAGIRFPRSAPMRLCQDQAPAGFVSWKLKKETEQESSPPASMARKKD